MSETRATTPVFPPGRYGRRRDGRRRRPLPLIVAAAVFALGALGVAWAYYQKFGQTDYNPEIIGWNEPTDAEMVIRFRVRVPEGGTASCVLRARDYLGYEVGTRTVAVPAAPGGGEVVVTESVPTTQRGSVGDVMTCRPAG
ncbi:DUF4307 domain-containing protein [Actinoplanes teichomyceticus]|uniref:Uncharacterized protein DUF4307 n=1 Tax=Actinoplanes teichomyceticus TaxID=1867 RepID=A0A561VH25_ACTTI|nr:DUF4307 domain-containing protein [Actinoplanes teichomyceticus]TWG10911.1 uncharacterized protein DUF4307 [Actinoplanes teichomyceticus]GIF12465.1 hypothetical protein Ate01nite_24970 [Actinoplanes teichomyceticus]